MNVRREMGRQSEPRALVQSDRRAAGGESGARQSRRHQIEPRNRLGRSEGPLLQPRQIRQGVNFPPRDSGERGPPRRWEGREPRRLFCDDKEAPSPKPPPPSFACCASYGGSPLPRFAAADARDSFSRREKRASVVKQRCRTARSPVARIERSEIRVRSRSLQCPSRVSLRSTQATKERKGKRNAGRRTVVSPAPNGCGRATDKAACAALSALGRARLPAFHHGSCQGVCRPLVRPGPGFVGKPSKRRGSLRRRPDHFQRRTSHAGRNAGGHDARTAREPS